MANIFKAVGNALTGGAIEKIVDRVLPDRMSEEEKARLAREIEKDLLKSQTDIIMAEASHDDKYVARARPTFLYIGYLVLVFNFILLPLLLFFTKQPMQPINLPEGFWYLFGTGYLGYTGARSADKNGWFASLAGKPK